MNEAIFTREELEAAGAPHGRESRDEWLLHRVGLSPGIYAVVELDYARLVQIVRRDASDPRPARERGPEGSDIGEVSDVAALLGDV